MRDLAPKRKRVDRSIKNRDSAPKRKRVDRSIKNQRRKTTKFITVKCGLFSRLRRTNGQVSCNISAAIRDRVVAYSKRVVKASLSLSGIIKDIYNRAAPLNNDDDNLEWIASVAVPQDVFTQTFIRQLLLGTRHAKLPNPLVTQYHRTHPQLVLGGNRYLGDRNIYSAGATLYLTNLKNALRTEIDQRIKTACGRRGSNGLENCVVRYSIHGWALPPSLGCCLPLPEAADSFVRIHRHMLGLEGHDRINDAWIADDANLPALLRYNVYLNKVYQDADQKLFNIVPICNIRAHFIRIDTSVLYGILREAGGGQQSWPGGCAASSDGV